MFFTVGLENAAGNARGGKRNGNNKSDDGSDKLQHITCFACGKKSHYADKCLSTKKDDMATAVLTGDRDADANFNCNANWEGTVYAMSIECSMHSVLDQCCMIKPDTALLDNQADISVVLIDLLEDIKECDPVRINGTAGMQIAVNKTGYLRDLDITVYTN